MADAVNAVTPEDRELRTLLGEARTIAVVGLSSKPTRPSLAVAAYLQERGYRIVPVNPGRPRCSVNAPTRRCRRSAN